MKLYLFKYLLFFISGIFVFPLVRIVPNPSNSGYDRIDPFKNGVAKVYKDDFVGFINQKGEEVIACRYNTIGEFYAGMAKVSIGENFGYILIG